MKEVKNIIYKLDGFWLKKKDKLGWLHPPAFADIKYDGEYCMADTTQDVLINSYGKARTDCPILRELPKDSVFYGELVWDNGWNGALYNLLSHKLDDSLSLFVFDVKVLRGIPVHDLPLIERRNLLLQNIPPLNLSGNYRTNHIFTVQSYYCEDLADVDNAFNDAVSHGYEGIVVKQANQTLKFGASCTWVKLKYTLTADLKVIYIDPSKERIECELIGHKPLGVKVMNKVKAKLQVGDIVEIEHYGVLSAGGLRHPVFKRVREPKKVSIDV